ncbi:hypothetical protein DO72_5167 [Burkholderia pseudomallei]|nr:hypothetical protein DO72_5167 [Burkholderia pseudomallei]
MIIAQQSHESNLAAQCNGEYRDALVRLYDFIREFQVGGTADADLVHRRPGRLSSLCWRRILRLCSERKHSVLAVPFPRPSHAALAIHVSGKAHDRLNEKSIFDKAAQVVRVRECVTRSWAEQKTDRLQDRRLPDVAST